MHSPEDNDKAYNNSKYLVRVRVPPVPEKLCLFCDIQGDCYGHAHARKDEGAWERRAVNSDQKV